jgi:hypothetical protein
LLAVFTIEKDFTVTIENHRTKALKVAKEAINSCTPDESLPPLERLDAYAACLSRQVNATLEAKQEEIEFEKSVRTRMADKMVEYACTDPKSETTKSTRNTTWTFRDETTTTASGGGTAKRIRDVPHKVQVLFESDANTVMLIKDFFTPQQCQQLMDASIPVGGSDDATSSSSSSAATQQNRAVPLSAKDRVGSLLAKMYQLVLGYVQTGVEYTHDPMLVLQIHTPPAPPPKGTGKECVVADAGASAGECVTAASTSATTKATTVHKAADKVLAQLRVVCSRTEDLVGGAVHYPKAGVHVNPVQQEAMGYAVLTMYNDPKTGAREKDPFVEELVECPVQQGQLVSIVQDFVAPA